MREKIHDAPGASPEGTIAKTKVTTLKLAAVAIGSMEF